MNISSLTGKKTVALALRDADAEFPNAKGVMILILLPDNSVQVRCSAVNTMEASWMLEVFRSALRRVIG